MSANDPHSDLTRRDVLLHVPKLDPLRHRIVGRAEARPSGSTSLQGVSDGRKHPIHLTPFEAHNRPILIYVTACTKRRRRILASPLAHEAILTAWTAASTWLVGRYVVMPDHVHFFCAPNAIDAPSLEKWMKFCKSLATRSMRKPGGTVWQRHHWDHQLRSGESYDDKWEYVRNNPVRHGYVTTADDWPYQGELKELRW